MDNLRRKNILWTLGTLIVIGLVFWGIKHETTSRVVDLTDSVLAQPVADESVVTGTFSCLPFKNGQDITDQNCVMGLASDDGKEYALDSSQITILSKTIGVKDRVRVVGTIQAPNTTVSEGSAFIIDGVIKVRAMQHAPKG